MKKVLSLVVVLMLCLAMTAFAVPSKTTGALISIEVDAENLPEGSSFFIKAVPEEEMTDEQKDIVAKEIEKLAKAEKVEDYFGEPTDEEDKPVVLRELLDAVPAEGEEEAPLQVNEFCAVIAGNYEEDFGKVKATMLFATPYEKDATVATMVGFVTVNEDGTQDVAWTALEGKVIDELGHVETEFAPKTVLDIQEKGAVLAIVNK